MDGRVPGKLEPMASTPQAALAGFHPVVQRWFRERLGQPTPPQRDGWPSIAEGRHTLIAAPTGTGKTLAAFLWAIDGLLRQGPRLGDSTQVLYISPLKALSNDVQKNLSGPLQELRELDPSLPDVRVVVRSGDTPAKERAAMTRRRPHILVTTPESLYILLTSNSGRQMLQTVRTVIVDEIHALARDKRGSHLALSLERLQALVSDHARQTAVEQRMALQRGEPLFAGVEPGGDAGADGAGADGASDGTLDGGGGDDDEQRPVLQRIGLSATQKPLEVVARLLTGHGRPCTLVDTGHLRRVDLAVEVTDSPLGAVCSHEQWGEIYERMATLIREHRTTLVFVGTRKLAERLAARLTDELGEEQVACHHGSLSRELRLSAEQRLKAGELSALVATASLELGIDIGDVDLVLQVGSARSIATMIQRVGRAGHGMDRVPKGRLFPLTIDELAEAGALLAAVRDGLLDRTPEPPAAIDILAQQIVASCASGDQDLDVLYAQVCRAAPYAGLSRDDFEAAIDVHTGGRWSLLHRDGVHGKLRATKRARIPALTSGGAIPDNADYDVLLEPEGTFIGTLNEDFAVEANRGDIFQLGNTSWRILKVEAGKVRVADARGEPPTLPFWLGEAPARTAELSGLIGDLREEPPDAEAIIARTGLDRPSAEQLAEYVAAGRQALGAVPTEHRVIAERFFDETGGMQLVLHAPFGGRINRAWGLALRKCFCRGFGFELQAAANEEAVLLSLGPHHSFPLEDVFKFLHSKSIEKTLTQALITAPVFTTRWRWNVSRSLQLPRMRNGKPVPPALQRMRADDLLVQSFPQVMACGENLPPGDLPVPEDVIVQQTIHDCLHEAMDLDGLRNVLRDIEAGRIETCAVDLPEPSVFSHGILSAQPYTFLDDAPLEERRTQAVMTRRGLDPARADELGALDPEAIERVREQAWPRPESAEELHEALGWMGFLTVAEGRAWQRWLDELGAHGRVCREGERWFATEAPRAGPDVLAGRLEALGPVPADDALFTEFASEVAQLEAAGVVLRTRIDGAAAWCNRRLLARIHRETLDRLRQQIEPVSAAAFLRFLVRWQHVDEDSRLAGPGGVLQVVRQLAGLQVPTAAWERHILPARVAGYRPGWLDELALSGQVAWGRLWGAGASAIRNTPVALVPRDELDPWLGLTAPGDVWSLRGDARTVFTHLAERGACFAQDLERGGGLLPVQVEHALSELVGLGLATCDAFAGLRTLLGRSNRRRRAGPAMGRWTLFRSGALPATVEGGSGASVPAAGTAGGSSSPGANATGAGGQRSTTPGGVERTEQVEFVARVLLRRTGVVFRRVLLRERTGVPWRELLRVYRRMEARGEVRGGRFVAGFSGEQFALPDVVPVLRAVRDAGEREPIEVVAADPLNFRGILTPDERVASTARRRVVVG